MVEIERLRSSISSNDAPPPTRAESLVKLGTILSAVYREPDRQTQEPTRRLTFASSRPLGLSLEADLTSVRFLRFEPENLRPIPVLLAPSITALSQEDGPGTDHRTQRSGFKSGSNVLRPPSDLAFSVTGLDPCGLHISPGGIVYRGGLNSWGRLAWMMFYLTLTTLAHGVETLTRSDEKLQTERLRCSLREVITIAQDLYSRSERGPPPEIDEVWKMSRGLRVITADLDCAALGALVDHFMQIVEKTVQSNGGWPILHNALLAAEDGACEEDPLIYLRDILERMEGCNRPWRVSGLLWDEMLVFAHRDVLLVSRDRSTSSPEHLDET